MSFFAAAVIGPPSPYDSHSIAGTNPQALLQATLESLGGPSVRVHDLDQVIPHLAVWQQEGTDRVLLLRADRPLLTTATLNHLVQAQQTRSTNWLALEPRAGRVPAGCAHTQWLHNLLGRAAPPHNLEEIHAEASAPFIAPLEAGEDLALDSLPALADAERLLRQRINLHWMQTGVRIIDPATTYIHSTVEIGPRSVILPNTHLWGQTTIGEDSQIGPNSIVRDSQIGNRCTVLASMVEQAVMEDESDIGPFGHLRKGAHLGRGAHMGNYGEIKNSTLGPNSKMGHFSYLGDATIGADVNIGAGTITCNYDGVHKHETVIEDGAFIGSDTMLVAPVKIGRGARIGAGSVVTHDIPAGAVAYGVPARVQRALDQEEGESSGPSK